MLDDVRLADQSLVPFDTHQFGWSADNYYDGQGAAPRKGASSLDGDAYWSSTIDMTPPSGEPVGDFVLVDDAITHEVRNRG